MDHEVSKETLTPPQKPDFKNPEKFEAWINNQVKFPYRGFSDKTHPDGTPWSQEELVQASKDQVRQTAIDFQKMGLDDKTIEDVLIDITKDLDKPENERP